MARIRTIKPEAFVSESLAEVSVNAERTFFGLLTQADDHGRFRDNAAIINGLLWPLRAEHTPVHAEEDLHQLAEAGLICRYTGCDGRRYLHVVTWFEHQKIDKPSQSRLPSCPLHHPAARCGACKGPCSACAEGRTDTPPSPRRDLPEASPSAPAELGRTSGTTADPSVGGEENGADGRGAPAGGTAGPGTEQEESAARKTRHDGSARARRGLPDSSAPGSRNLDPGPSAPSGRTAPAAAPSAQTLIGEYAAACPSRPPAKVLSHLGREVKQLLAEGIDPCHVRAGLERFRAKPMHPSVLASLVNEAMNADSADSARPGNRPGVSGHTAWANPADASAYAEEL
ncbi:hypothetical protein ACLIYP_01940 [Streptomyces nanhaiensis]|uniref:hypothetical protein n=1 Tax=Streptomyces nanhaiensis TaxID=679319 RepID=UPI00399D1989